MTKIGPRITCMHSDMRLQVRALRVHLITAVEIALVHLSLLQVLVVAVVRERAVVGRLARCLEVAIVRGFIWGGKTRIYSIGVQLAISREQTAQTRQQVKDDK